ncbi:MAG TPA: hypothetical protein VMC79_10035 [Rectinemataceae bacterium]|nr:hypothetical protein [Rectinemataceae bacterium]
MRDPDPLAFARGLRMRLNATLLASGACFALSVGIGAGGIALLALESMNLVQPGPRTIALWATGAVLSLVLGLGLAARKRLGLKEAAAWFDAGCATEEILSAALTRTQAKGTGPYDGEISRRLSAVLAAHAPAPYPRATLLRRLALALGLALAFGAALSWQAWPKLFRDSVSSRLDASAAAALEEKAQIEGRLSPAAAQALGAWLFPEDKRLAARAGRDLEEGRLGDLRSLLRAATQSLAMETPDSANARRRRQLLQDQSRLGSLPRSPESTPSAGASEDGRNSGGAADQGGQGSGQARSSDGEEGTSPQPRSPAPFEGDGPEAEGGERPPSQNLPPGQIQPGQRPSPELAPDSRSPSGGGEAPSEGSSGGSPGAGGSEGDSGASPSPAPGAGRGAGAPRDWGTISPEASAGPLVIPPDPTKPYFQFALPGLGAPRSGAHAVGLAARSAETGVLREDVPADYQDFLRNYFLSLAREAEAEAQSEKQQGGGP